MYGTTEWTTVKDNACFSSSSILTNYTFNPPRSGTVTAVKLVHISGAVSCESTDWTSYTKWGCWSMPLVYLVQHYADSTVHEVLPTADTLSGYSYNPLSHCDTLGNDCNSWGYYSSGQDAYSDELVWTDSTLNLYVSTNDKFSLQYSEACCNSTVEDNDGISCAEVYFQYDPTPSPNNIPSKSPTSEPSSSPTKVPTVNHSWDPTTEPTLEPTTDPTIDTTSTPTITQSATEVELSSQESEVLIVMTAVILIIAVILLMRQKLNNMQQGHAHQFPKG